MADEPSPRSELDVGDKIEYGLSLEYRSKTGNMWPKIAVTSSVREGETGDTAYYRIVDFVTEKMEEQLLELAGK